MRDPSVRTHARPALPTRARPLLRALAGATAVLSVAALSLPAGPLPDVVPAPDVATGASAAPDPLAPLVGAAGNCDALDPTRCLLPFPNDAFTVPDGRTATGLRVELPIEGMPRSTGAKPMDPAEWNRNDGWSPGSPILAFLPGLDVQRSFGIDVPQLERPELSLADDAPIVLLDADTGQRHPFWAELDTHPDTADDERLLVVRPLVNLAHGHRYVVALRDLVDADGAPIPAGEAFAALRDADPDELAAAPAGSQQARYHRLFGDLEDAGVERDELVLAWDLTVGSAESLAGRMLAIRDTAFALLGDTDLADLEVDGDAPPFTVTEVVQTPDSGDTAYRVTGTVEVPNFLTLPQDTARSAGFPYPALPEVGDVYGQMPPGSRFHYGTGELRPGPTDLPTVNPAVPTLDAEFTCSVPRSVAEGGTAQPMLYGHGLLGDKRESTGGSASQMREAGFMTCGVDWAGMATEDVLNVATILADMGNFASLVDRVQQGMLNFLLVGRALVHPDGFAADPAFQREDGSAVYAGELVYDGNSQGAIIGGALMAVAPDMTRGTLGVPGMNYSTLLNRSVDWEGSYGDIMYAFYPDKIDQQLVFALVQQLWDRSETNGYAAHATDDPLPNTPPHQLLLHVALGDYQVANVSAEVMARTMGAELLDTSLAAGRHWADTAGQRTFSFETFRRGANPGGVGAGPDARLPRAPSGSALVYFDSGNPLPPSANVPPERRGADPHGHPRRDLAGAEQKVRFYATGEVVDVLDGAPWFTAQCPVHEGEGPDC